MISKNINRSEFFYPMKKLLSNLLCIFAFLALVMTSTKNKDADEDNGEDTETNPKDESNGKDGKTKGDKEGSGKRGKTGNGAGSVLALLGAIVTGVCMCAMI